MVYYPPQKQFDIKEIIKKQDQDVKELSQLESVQRKNKKRLFIKKAVFVFTMFIFVTMISGGYMIYKANSTFDKITGQQNSVLKSFIRFLPLSGDNFFQVLPVEGESKSAMDRIRNGELDRLNILILGMRGANDPNGGLLTDTVMVVSVEPHANKAALISVPRDLYVYMPYSDDAKGKINEAYEFGVKNGKSYKAGLEYSKKVVSDVTGLDIHYVVSLNFKAFKEIIDTLGGVTVTLSKPFSEKNQFAEGVIDLPAGKQVMDGDTALLFVRARFSTSDFDRAKRQQQILLAVKEKAFSLGILYNPIKVLSILNSLGNHVRTDAELWEIQELAVVLSKIDESSVRRKVFDTSKDGLLYASRDSNGSYILLPEGGNFDKIQEECKNIFN
jgi:LCP family protein required for cell wall assembly